MRIARVSVPDIEGPVFGIVDGNQISLLVGHPFHDLVPAGAVLNLDDVKLLAPVLPSKVICIGKNYADHAAEMGTTPPEEPVIFIKPTTSVIGDGQAIVLPPQSTEVHHESELAIVIGHLCRNVTVERAHEVILGYTCANDVTARDLQERDGQWTRAKSFDTFCPIGPWIETELDPSNLDISCEVDDEERQHANTSDLIFSVSEIVAFVSSVMTLLPGDVILTGTPSGVASIKDGETVNVSIEGIGTLSNPVVSR